VCVCVCVCVVRLYMHLYVVCLIEGGAACYISQGVCRESRQSFPCRVQPLQIFVYIHVRMHKCMYRERGPASKCMYRERGPASLDASQDGVCIFGCISSPLRCRMCAQGKVRAMYVVPFPVWGTCSSLHTHTHTKHTDPQIHPQTQTQTHKTHRPTNTPPNSNTNTFTDRTLSPPPPPPNITFFF